ncbi:MAG: ion transporter [Chloroflexaceae bacterium]|nr:ion transporter [Chloroflexaceae bacterium]NJO06175.1 ion transporter [Chloroflexaceae bacterium]
MRLRVLVETEWFQTFITVVIIVNAITLGLETSETLMAAYGPLLVALDHLALGIFVAEIILKLLVYRTRFFFNGWNIFDFVIVGIALLPGTGALSVLRALRVLRVLRLFSTVPSLRRVVDSLIAAIPGMTSIIAVMTVVFYVCSVIATKLFRGDFAEWFGSLDRSMYTLFQVMTLESWSMGIVRPVMEVHPWAWVFFTPFIVVTSFAVLNLFIAVLVNATQAQEEANMQQRFAILHDQLNTIQQEVQTLTRLLHERSNPPD